MFCKNCGTQLPDGAAFCSVCGANQSTDNVINNIDANANTVYVQPQNFEYNNIMPYQNYPANAKTDKSNVGLNILSWFVPIFGVIYYFIKKSEKPIEAKGTLKTALISIGVNVLISIIAIILVFVGALASVNDNDYDDNLIVDGYEDIYDDAYGESYDEDVIDDENTTNDKTSDVNISTDWTNYTVSVEGVEITLPISYTDFAEKTGCSFSDSQDTESTLKSNYYTSVKMTATNGAGFTIYVLNASEEVKTLDECMVTAIYQYKSYSGENANIVFPGNLCVGQEITGAELKDLFGEPNDTYNSDDNTHFIYRYYENYNVYFGDRSFEISVYEGVISDISIEKTT